MAKHVVLGIDVGGSGIKGALVNTKKGELLSERHRIPTPEPSTPAAVTEIIAELVDHFKWEGSIGIGFPAVVQNGIVRTASNIDKSWIGLNAAEMLHKRLKLPICIVNDADAAGIAEMKFGAGKDCFGTVLLVTVGTGIGTVLFSAKELVTNTELGHLYLQNGLEAEEFASDAARERENIEWTDWGKRFNIYLNEMHKLFWPELIIVGGGVSKRPEKFMDSILVPAKVVMAIQKNEAGIIGAALAAKAFVKQKKK